jgi:NodT family efflux transporter outer membrane factor (OMF) lipoprotein
MPGDDGPPNSENSAQVPIEEFFSDPNLTCLLHESLAFNYDLKIVGEDVQIAGNVILSRRGAYVPLVTIGGGASLTKVSSYTPEGAGIRDDEFRNGITNTLLPNPLPNYLLGPNLIWQLDIWRQLRNARDAAVMRYFSTGEGRNYLATRLIAEIADNYYGLLAQDKRLENLNEIIAIQEQSLKMARALFEGARTTELGVQRFMAEVRKNQSERLIVQQDIIQTENRINTLVGRFPQSVARTTGQLIDQYIDLKLHALSVGVPSQLLLYRPDIRQAERDLEANGIDVKVARADFFPKAFITSGVGYEAFNPRWLFITPEALIYTIAGDLIAPLINKKAIQAEYLSANAKQLQALYNYQRTILNAYTDVINRVTKVENYRKSIEIKKQQVIALEKSVQLAMKLFQFARVEYIDVLFAQRDLLDARRVLIDTKREQLTAVVYAYQALGGGGYLFPIVPPAPLHFEHWMHFGHSNTIKVATPGPAPLPPPLPPPVAVSGPVPFLTPPPPPPTAGSGPAPLPTPPPPPAAVSPPVPLPTPPAPAEEGPVPLPTPPAAVRGPVPLPTPPAAERGRVPPPAPMGGG